MKKLIFGLMASAAIAFPALAQQMQDPRNDQMQRYQPQQSPGQAPGQAPGGALQVSPDQLTSNQVMQVQQALNERGFSVGEVDGVWGPMTDNAYRSFQQQQGIPADGQLNVATASALGIDVSQFRGPDPGVSPGAPPSDQYRSPGETAPDEQAPGAAPQQRLPGTDDGPSGPTR